jgi:hypothetical protein
MQELGELVVNIPVPDPTALAEGDAESGILALVEQSYARSFNQGRLIQEVTRVIDMGRTVAVASPRRGQPSFVRAVTVEIRYVTLGQGQATLATYNAEAKPVPTFTNGVLIGAFVDPLPYADGAVVPLTLVSDVAGHQGGNSLCAQVAPWRHSVATQPMYAKGVVTSDELAGLDELVEAIAAVKKSALGADKSAGKLWDKFTAKLGISDEPGTPLEDLVADLKNAAEHLEIKPLTRYEPRPAQAAAAVAKEKQHERNISAAIMRPGVVVRQLLLVELSLREVLAELVARELAGEGLLDAKVQKIVWTTAARASAP